MTKIIAISIILIFALYNIITAQEIKTIQIYNNNLTHTNIKANISYTNGEITKEEVYYTVAYAAMWTGRLSSVVVYSGNLEEMSFFLTEINKFSQANEKNLGADTTIMERNVSINKVAGIKCIIIKYADESINTSFKAIDQAQTALNTWIKENK